MLFLLLTKCNEFLPAPKHKVVNELLYLLYQ